MTRLLRIALLGIVSLQLWGCGGGRIIPKDIGAMMATEGGQWALKAIEGHGGIWRWRQRAFVSIDYVKLTVAHGMDTTITGNRRQRDTTITPRLDTLINLRERITYDLINGYVGSQSASTSPLILKGLNSDSAWVVRDQVPSADSAELWSANAHLIESRESFALPFSLLDTTLQFSLTGEEPAVDTNFVRGEKAGTFDTTITSYTIQRLKVEPAPAGSGLEWLVLYVDGRDGKIRKLLSPRTDSGATSATWLTVWSEQQTTLGMSLGGRRASYPADANGNITGPLKSDRSYYNVEFSREIVGSPFMWTPPEMPDSLKPAADSSAAASGA